MKQKRRLFSFLSIVAISTGMLTANSNNALATVSGDGNTGLAKQADSGQETASTVTDITTPVSNTTNSNTQTTVTTTTTEQQTKPAVSQVSDNQTVSHGKAAGSSQPQGDKTNSDIDKPESVIFQSEINSNQETASFQSSNFQKNSVKSPTTKSTNHGSPDFASNSTSQPNLQAQTQQQAQNNDVTHNKSQSAPTLGKKQAPVENGNATVNFAVAIEDQTGAELTAPMLLTGKSGTDFKIDPPTIPGYTLMPFENLDGVFKAGQSNCTLVYKPSQVIYLNAEDQPISDPKATDVSGVVLKKGDFVFGKTITAQEGVYQIDRVDGHDTGNVQIYDKNNHLVKVITYTKSGVQVKNLTPTVKNDASTDRDTVFLKGDYITVNLPHGISLNPQVDDTPDSRIMTLTKPKDTFKPSKMELWLANTMFTINQWITNVIKLF